jgi:DNA primase
MAHLHGFDRAVAGMGTAFTARQAALLARFGEQQKVTLVYDGDAAGRAAAEKTLDVLLEAGLDVRVALLPEGRDVDEILLEEGPAAFQAVLDRALDVFAFRWAELARRHDVATVPGRTAAAHALGGTLARVKDPVQRDLWIAELVRRLGGGRETEQTLRSLLAQRLAPPRGPAPGGGGPDRPPEPPAARLRREAGRLDEQVLLAAALAGGATADAVARAVGPEDFADAVRRRVYNAVLDLRERGSPHDARALLARFADDPEVAAELADLPERPQLAEQALYLVNDIEKRRVNARLRQAGTRARGAEDQEGPLRDIVDGSAGLTRTPGRGVGSAEA